MSDHFSNLSSSRITKKCFLKFGPELLSKWKDIRTILKSRLLFIVDPFHCGSQNDLNVWVCLEFTKGFVHISSQETNEASEWALDGVEECVSSLPEHRIDVIW